MTAANVIPMSEKGVGFLATLMSWATQWLDTPAGRLMIFTITPERAARMLEERHERQRAVNKTHVGRIADDMMSGRWRANGDIIRFGSDLKLWDGQHRLSAVIQTGINLPGYSVLVMRSEGAELTIDTGMMVRTPQHMVKMHGGDAVGMTGTRSAAIVYEHNDFNDGRTARMSKLARHEIVVASDRKAFLRALPHKVSKGVLAAAIRCSRVDEDQARAFFSGVLGSDPEICGQYSKAANMLAAWILQSRGTGAGQAFSRESAHRSIRLWNAWRSGAEHRIKQLPKYLGPSHDMPAPL